MKNDFPILKRKINGKRLVYLDNAATSQKPTCVIKAIESFYKHHNANVHRGLHTLSEEASQMYEDSRKTVAEFIGGESHELVFVSNATEGINLVAWAWAFKNIKAGDEILVTEMEHHANLVPWQEVSRVAGTRLVMVGVDNEGRLKMAEFERKLSKKTMLVAVTQMSNVTGVINPIKAMVKMAKKVGARVLVDGAQSVQHMEVDVKDLGCDFLGFAGHKMMGPMGIGGLYIKKEIQKEMGVFKTGGGMISEVHKDKARWARGVEKWEAGTPNVVGAVGLKAAVEYIKSVGIENIRRHELELTEYGIKRLKSIKGIRIIGPENMKARGGVISFVIDGIHAHDVAQILDSVGVAVRSGHHCAMPLHNKFKITASVRLSFGVYNTKEDVDQLMEGLKKVRKVFK